MEIANRERMADFIFYRAAGTSVVESLSAAVYPVGVPVLCYRYDSSSSGSSSNNIFECL